MFITFLLFNYLTTPETIARQILGDKAKKEVVDSWIHMKGLDKPYFYNSSAPGLGKISNTLFIQHMYALITLNFGRSYEDDKPIADKIIKRAGPSLSFSIPIFIFGIMLSISFSLVFAYFRSTYVDKYGTFLCVLGMSIVILIYIIAFQWIFSIQWKLYPISGWASGANRIRFVMLPIVIGIISAMGGNIRFYRTIMIEETTRDYVRTARSKGLSETVVLFKHILKNAMIPILTNAVMMIPFLFMGSLLTENFFGIPGLGNFAITALHSNDYPSLNAIIFIGAILYQFGLILTDISYALVDPRVAFD
jgi:peptide/nickel transport system permease protein